MEDNYFSPKFAVEKPKVSLKKPDDKKSEKKQPVIKKADPKQALGDAKEQEASKKSSRSEITRRYYVRKSLMQGKVPKNLKEEDVKNPKLEKLNDILNRLKKKAEPEPVESDDEEPDDEETDDEETDDEEPDDEEHKARQALGDDKPVKVAKRQPQVLDKDDVISRLDAITDMLMYLVEQEEARAEESDDDENAVALGEPEEEEEKPVAPVRHANINFPNQRPRVIYF